MGAAAGGCPASWPRGPAQPTVSRWTGRVPAGWLVAALVVALATALPVHAQDMEPRAYANAPVGLNFVVAGYAHTRGDVVFDAASPIEDAEVKAHAAYLAYVRALNVWGRAGKLDVVLPHVWASGTAKAAGQPRARQVSGLADPRVRLSVLLYGAPALSMEQFAEYQPDLIVGASLAVTAPLGQYDAEKLFNIGTNRWSVKPELGISKTWGPVTLELMGSVTFYTRNDDSLGGQTLDREPLYSAQAHVIYHTRRGLWVALDATYYTGGQMIVDGDRGERQENLRLGLTVSVPLGRHHSVKFFGSTGAMARVGGDFDTIGVAWQYRWGAGL